MKLLAQRLPKYSEIGGLENFKFADKTVADIVSDLLPYVLTLSGIILFLILIYGGFDLLTSGGNSEKVKRAQEKIVSALIGFLIIFLAYWITQLLEVIFGISIFQ